MNRDGAIILSNHVEINLVKPDTCKLYPRSRRNTAHSQRNAGEDQYETGSVIKLLFACNQVVDCYQPLGSRDFRLYAALC